MIKAKNSIKGKISPYEKLQGKTNFSVIRPELEELTITPSEENQTFISEKDGYSSVTVNGDSDLKPENIKEGVSIFGIEGELVDTGDANAIAQDIALDKVAYVQNRRITGTFVPLDTSDATATEEDIVRDKTAYANGEKIVGTNDKNATADIVIKSGSSNYSGLGAIIKTIPENLTISRDSAAYMFSFCLSLITIPLIDTSNVISMSYMFQYCRALTEIPLLNTSKVTGMPSMFYNCSSLKTIPKLNTSNVTSMYNMFSGCSSLTEIPLLNTSKVTNISYMFTNCSSLKTIPLLNTGNATNMNSIFSGCSSLTEIPLLNTSKVTFMQNMFSGCSSLVTVPELNTSSVSSYYNQNMFKNCTSLSDESLNNILAMCTKMTKVTGSSYKTLKYMGLNSTQATRCQSLSNYDAFIAAGWRTGF